MVSAAWQPPPEYEIFPSADGHFFQDGEGEPFFWQADTAWLLFHRLNRTECEIYLSDRASKGYNVVLAVGFQQIGIDSPNRNGDLTFVNQDVTKPEENQVIDTGECEGVCACEWSEEVATVVEGEVVALNLLRASVEGLLTTLRAVVVDATNAAGHI